MKKYQYLTDEQAEHFLEHGYVRLHDCFSREMAEEWTTFACQRLGVDPKDPTTWTKERVHMATRMHSRWRDFSPKAWGAGCELVGGEERMQMDCTLGDGFIINFNEGADRPWQPPSAESRGWHKDGDFFLHFLDSPEQALLTLVIWSDIEPRGGGTFGAGDSVSVVARFLAEHPEGVEPMGFDVARMIHECHEFVEFTGKVGDIILLHPFILHASSQNHSGKLRFLTNPPMKLSEPMNFNRSNPDDFSLVERAVLRGLGVERFDFKPTSPRREIEPERKRIQRVMFEEEQARLAAKP